MGEQRNSTPARAREEDEVMADLAKLETGTANVVGFTKRTVAEPGTSELVAEILRGVTLAGTAAPQVADDVRKRKSRPDYGAAREKLQNTDS
jgi:hypothetical protein